MESLFVRSVEAAVNEALKDEKVLLVYNKSAEEHNDDAWLSEWFHWQELDSVRVFGVWLKLVDGSAEFEMFQQLFGKVVTPSFYLIKDSQIKALYTKETETSSIWPNLVETLKGRNENDDKEVNQSQDECQRSNTTGNNESEMPLESEHEGTNENTTENSNSSISHSIRKTEREIVMETALNMQRKELMRQKRLDEEERQRIIRLVRADKAEREAKEKSKLNDVSLDDPLEIHDNIKDKSRLQTEMCTLLIRLTNGDTISEKFNSQSNLTDVRNWVDAHRTDPYVAYAFHKNIPRTTIDDTEESKSLKELDLVPRSVLILKPLTPTIQSQGAYGIAQSPGLINKVFNGFSSWWGPAIELEDDETGNDSTASISRDPSNMQQQKFSSNMSSLTKVKRRIDGTPDEEPGSSAASSKNATPFSGFGVGRLTKEPSEASVPSRSMSPNVFKFINQDDEQDSNESKTYNGNTTNLEKNKDDKKKD